MLSDTKIEVGIVQKDPLAKDVLRTHIALHSECISESQTSWLDALQSHFNACGLPGGMHRESMA